MGGRGIWVDGSVEPGVQLEQGGPRRPQAVAVEGQQVAVGLGVLQLGEREGLAGDGRVARVVAHELQEQAGGRAALVQLAGGVEETRSDAERGGHLQVVSQRQALDENGEPIEAVAESKEPAAAPTFLPIDTMVVNLADPGGERFAQVGVTLELADSKTAERVKQFMPSIRSGMLLLISQKTADELLSREGKDKLAHDILREVSRPLGFTVPEAGALPKPAAAPATKGKAKAKDKAAEQENPVRRVLFSGFIIQ